MEPNAESALRLAVLIDGENIPSSYADQVFAHAEAMGTIVSKELYGASSAMVSWVAPVLKYAIHPNLTIRTTKGKNTSDIALVIGAMDTMMSGYADSVVIVSNDSDFSALALRLRESGINVIGMGTSKTNQLWRVACTTFILLDHENHAHLEPSAPAQEKAAPMESAKPQRAQKAAQQKPVQQEQQAQRDAQADKAALKEQHLNAIREIIRAQLAKNGGRMQTSALFLALNRSPEYKAERRGAGKRPLAYLAQVFPDLFRVENAEDGMQWICAADFVPPEEQAAASEPVEEPAQAEEPAAAPEAPQEAEPVPAPEADAQAQYITGKLVDGGMDSEVAEAIVSILLTSSDRRAAYNRIRKRFGAQQGRAYYNQVKQISEASQED